MPVEWRGGEAKGIMRRNALNGLWKAAQYLRGVSQSLVPYDEHILEATATVSLDEARMASMVSYDTPYAARQHEELNYTHKPGRQAKYLEQPLRDHAGIMQQIIGKETGTK